MTDYYLKYIDNANKERAQQTFEAKLNTKYSIAVYEYFGCSGPITKSQKEKYDKLPLIKWKT